MARALLPGADHVMEYHMMVKGEGSATVVGLDPVQLRTGDVVTFPQGDGHVLSSALGLRPSRIVAD